MHDPAHLLNETSRIVTAMIPTSARDTSVATMIAEVYAALAATNGPSPEPVAVPEPDAVIPVVSMKKSLASPDVILSMIDGKPYKALKRHLGTHGLTPDEYRARYNLPASYPMVAPAYAAARSAMAKASGLGRKPAANQPTAE